MRAITVWPGVANSARLDNIPEPPLSDGVVLVRTMALGVCGTDREIISGRLMFFIIPCDNTERALAVRYLSGE